MYYLAYLVRPSTKFLDLITSINSENKLNYMTENLWIFKACLKHIRVLIFYYCE